MTAHRATHRGHTFIDVVLLATIGAGLAGLFFERPAVAGVAFVVGSVCVITRRALQAVTR